jgi:prolyl-tRNA synthetase
MAEPAAAVPDRTKDKKPPKEKKPKEKKPPKEKKAGGADKPAGGKDKAAPNADTKGISVTREQDLGLWYSEVLTKAGIVSYYDVQDTFLLNFELS